MDYDELAGVIESIFNPEPDEDAYRREWAHPRLTERYGLDFTFMKTLNWEGSTSHPNTRIWPEGDTSGDSLTRNSDVPLRLFMSALRVFGDSILAYRNANDEPSELRFYPPVILTFWSAFEAFVRHTSELMIHTSKDLPSAVADYLRDEVTTVDNKGKITHETRYRSPLDRYAVLLQYGFGLSVDKGSRHWQALKNANEIRDYYTHIDALQSRSMSSDQVLEYLEAILLGVIWPSAEVKRTILLHVHDLYCMWVELGELACAYLPKGHIEQPFFHSWYLGGESHMFYCPFTNADEERFPNSDQKWAHSANSATAGLSSSARSNDP